MSQQSTESTNPERTGDGDVNQGDYQVEQSETADPGTTEETSNDPAETGGGEQPTDARQGLDEDEAPTEPGDRHVTESRTVQSGSTPTDVENDEDKPVWNVETHGPLDEKDPRRDLYRVIGEK